MTEIPIHIVKELRQKTGAGMMICKQVIQQTNGDLTKAIEWLLQNNIGVSLISCPANHH